MTVNYSAIEDYVNGFAVSHLPNGTRLRVQPNDMVLLLENNSTDVIWIGDNAVSMILLYSSIAQDRKLFRDILFFYYWSNKNWQLRRLRGAALCLHKLIGIIDKKVNRIGGYAQQFYNDILLLYMAGHEAAHICFAQDADYKKTAIEEVISIFDSLKEVEKSVKNKVIKRAYHDVSQNISIYAIAEELACDRESISYIFNRLKDAEGVDGETLKVIMLQILNMTIMFQYDVMMNELMTFNFKRLSYLQYIRNYIGMGELRLFSAARVIDNLLPYEPMSQHYQNAHKEMQRLLSSYGIINVRNVSYATGYTELCVEEEPVHDIKDSIDYLTQFLNALLLGEELPTEYYS